MKHVFKNVEFKKKTAAYFFDLTQIFPEIDPKTGNAYKTPDKLYDYNIDNGEILIVVRPAASDIAPVAEYLVISKAFLRARATIDHNTGEIIGIESITIPQLANARQMFDNGSRSVVMFGSMQQQHLMYRLSITYDNLDNIQGCVKTYTTTTTTATLKKQNYIQKNLVVNRFRDFLRFSNGAPVTNTLAIQTDENGDFFFFVFVYDFFFSFVSFLIY